MESNEPPRDDPSPSFDTKRLIRIPACRLFLETALNFLISVEELTLSINRAIDGIVCHDVKCVHCSSTRQRPTPNDPEGGDCCCLDLLQDRIFCTHEQLKEICQNMTILDLFTSTTKVDAYKKELEWLNNDQQPPIPPPSLRRPPSPMIGEIERNDDMAYTLAEIRSIVNYLNKFQLKEYAQQRSALIELKLFFQRLAFLQADVYNAASFIDRFENFDFLTMYREFCKSGSFTHIDAIFFPSFSTEPIVDCRLLYKHRVNLLLYYYLPKPDFSSIR